MLSGHLPQSRGERKEGERERERERERDPTKVPSFPRLLHADDSVRARQRAFFSVHSVHCAAAYCWPLSPLARRISKNGMGRKGWTGPDIVASLVTKNSTMLRWKKAARAIGHWRRRAGREAEKENEKSEKPSETRETRLGWSRLPIQPNLQTYGSWMNGEKAGQWFRALLGLGNTRLVTLVARAMRCHVNTAGSEDASPRRWGRVSKEMKTRLQGDEHAFAFALFFHCDIYLIFDRAWIRASVL